MNKEVQCLLCPRRCRLQEGMRGDCRVRINLGGRLETLVYGNPCAVHIDPVEKKPLFHLLPESTTFSIATAGCNLHCKFCQNWSISQVPPEETRNMDMPPARVVQLALRGGCRSIAYTYSEPVVFYEYMLATAKLAREKGLKNIMVTAAYINPEPLKEICKWIDAANIDLKGFTEKYYQEVCSGLLQPVLDSIEITRKAGVWVELTNLIIPTLNDDPADIKKMCLWIKNNVGENTPLHFSRFYPMYKLKNIPLTSAETLFKAREIALEAGLRYVYVGNIPGQGGGNTYCPNCNRIVIGRIGYSIKENNLRNGKCAFCGWPIAGVWR